MIIMVHQASTAIKNFNWSLDHANCLIGTIIWFSYFRSHRSGSIYVKKLNSIISKWDTYNFSCPNNIKYLLYLVEKILHIIKFLQPLVLSKDRSKTFCNMIYSDASLEAKDGNLFNPRKKAELGGLIITPDGVHYWNKLFEFKDIPCWIRQNHFHIGPLEAAASEVSIQVISKYIKKSKNVLINDNLGSMFSLR